MEEQKTPIIPKKRTNPMKKIVNENAETRMKKVGETTDSSEKNISKTTSTSSTVASKENKAKQAKVESPKEKTATSKKRETVRSSTATTKVATTKASTTKKTTSKTTTKKATTKPKVNTAHITSTKIDPKTGLVKTTKTKTPKVEKKPVVEPVVEPKKKVVKKKTTPKKTPVVTIEPQPKEDKSQAIVRPTPKKVKQWTKEEKVLYKKLDEAFSTVANMAMVIEERTMDTKNMPNLTIGEIHLIEMVNRYNNKPMTLIANKLHITVGAMTICLNRLVQKGYLLRTRDEMDRRVILLSVTPDGKKIVKFHSKFHDDILGIVLDTIPLAQATKVMSQFAYVLEYYFDPSIVPAEEKKTSKKEKK